MDSRPSLTVTQKEQLKVEGMVAQIYHALIAVSPTSRSRKFKLWRDKHIEFLTRGLRQLGPSYHVLDANRPWVCYWILHSIALLGEPIDDHLGDRVVDFLCRCEDKDGGYGGGPKQQILLECEQINHGAILFAKNWFPRLLCPFSECDRRIVLKMPHLATSYAAVNTLVTLGSERALSSINRDTMYKFLLRMKDSSGAFRMHDGGEIDVRACYTAISVASLLKILDYELVKDVGSYILRCQTYEGGIAGEPGSEAHGGYTFCGLAALILINEADRLDLPSLIDWVAFRQGVECGFQGRTNKLVDGCYSFWQGGALYLMQRLLTIVEKQLTALPVTERQPSVESSSSTTLNLTGKFPDFGFTFIERHIECGPLFHSIALQQYVLLCSQEAEGGFKDKPGKQRDHYHSCYCLSGLSVSQHSNSKSNEECPPPNAVLGSCSNQLESVHPLYNVVLDQYEFAHEFFSAS